MRLHATNSSSNGGRSSRTNVASFQPETVAQVDEPEPEFAGEGEHIGVDDAHGAVEEAEEVVNLNADAPDAPHPTRPVPASEESR